ncbi:MAG TPA: ATP-binding protein, partial [Candidatus Saccharimonadales bacterium]
TRDVKEDTISKAQIIYNIIASTWQKGYKNHFYGQRHFAFEIVGVEGFIYFYAAVPVALVDVIKQAIVSAYPTARLEEVSEHNIFSQVGKLNGTLGGELVLKDSYAYPIATYLDLKQDALQAILSSMADLNKEDGAAIQILLRPAGGNWRKVAKNISSTKRKGGKVNSSGSETLLWWLRNVPVALFKAPEHKEGEKQTKELSNLEQATLDSIDDKTRHPAFEVVIRVVVSSNVSQRSQSMLSQIVASFALFDQPGKNGFKYVPAKDIDNLVTSYIMRFFPQHNTHTILNSVELATIFHFPDQNNIPTSQLVKQASKQVDGPRNIPEDGLLMGFNVFRGVRKPIRLSLPDRQRHVYAVGQTGTGKSMFLENLALQDMLNGNGFAFVDPHGDTVENLLAMIPKERTEDLIYFSPGDMDYPMGLNLFEFHSPEQKDFLIQEALNMLYKLYDPQHQGIMGPRYEHLFRMAALTVMADPAGGTFVDIPKLFRDPKYVDQKLQYVTDQNVIEFWKKEMPQSQRSNDFGEVVSWFVSKFGAFLSNDMMRNIIGQTESAFDLRDVMDNKKILLVNLSKGGTGELNSKLLGMIFVMKFQAAAMSRVDLPESERNDFALYVDEFQNFSTDSLATIMSEARKFHLNLIVANQFTTQLSPEIRDAVFGNIGTIVSFRIGQNDVESIGKYFQPAFDAEDLLRIPNYNTVVRTLIGGVPTQPFTMATLPQLGTPNKRLAEALKQLSAAKYGRPKAVVEKEIFARMATKEEPKPAFSPQAQSLTNPYPSAQNPWNSS